MKNKFDKILCSYLIINIIYIFMIGVLHTYHILDQALTSKGYIVLLITNIIIILILYKQNIYHKNLIDLLIIFMTFFGVISTIFAYKFKVAIFGEYLRYEGLLSIMYYFSILILTSFLSKKSKKIIIFSFLIFGFIQTFYATFQLVEFPGIQVLYHENKPWASAFLTNPNFFGTLTLISLSYAIGLFIEEKNPKMNFVYGLLMFFYTYGLLVSNTLSCLVGLIMVMLVVLIYIFKNKKYKKFIIVMSILLLTIIFTSFCDQTTLVKDLLITKKQTVSLASGTKENTNNYGTGRVFIWKKTIKVVPKYLLHGIGVDNFKYILDGKPIVRYIYYYDKAHNEILQILVTQGIFCCLAYIVFWFLTIKNGLKKSFKNKEIYYILPIIGYLTQAMFNISVITVAPLFYIAIGLTIDRENS